VARTIDCCHEALARARDKAGVRLGDVDYLVLVGGCARVPRGRDSLPAAFLHPRLRPHAPRAAPALAAERPLTEIGSGLLAGSTQVGGAFCTATPATCSGSWRTPAEYRLKIPNSGGPQRTVADG